MTDVTGNLRDIGFGYLVGLNPEIIFTLNAPQLSQSRVWATEPVVVTPDGFGVFTVNLADTTLMFGDAYYTMSVRWNKPGPGGSNGYSPVDVFFDTPLRVSGTTGDISDFIGAVTNMSLVYISLLSPTIKKPNMLWWKTDPTNPNNPANTGKIYRWENV